MPSANYFRRIADKARGIPGRMGLREHSATLIKTMWTGGRTGEGDKITEEYPLLVNGTENPKIKFPGQRDIALGLMPLGTITIGPLTPEFPGGGIVRDFVASQQLERSDTLHILVTGPQHPNGCLYRIDTVNVDKALRLNIICNTVSGN